MQSNDEILIISEKDEFRMKEVRFVEQLLGLPGTGSHFGKEDGVRPRNRSNPYFWKVTKPLNLDCSRVLGIQA